MRRTDSQPKGTLFGAVGAGLFAWLLGGQAGTIVLPPVRSGAARDLRT